MRLFLKSLLLLCLLAVCATQGATEASAQKMTFNDVKRATVNGGGPIFNGKEIVGYYSLFMVDKKDRKTYEYAVKIMDADLKVMQTQKFTAPRYSFSIGAAFNGDALCIAVLNRREEELILHSFSAAGEKLGTKTMPMGKKSIAYVMQLFGYSEEAETYGSFIQAVPNSGFVLYMPEIAGLKSYSYTIHHLPNDLSAKGAWKASAPTGGAKYKMAFGMGTSEGYIFTNVTEKPKLVTANGMATILYVHDAKTGEELFKADVSKGRPALSATNAFYDKDLEQVTVIGMYFKPGADVMKDFSSGVGVKRYSLDGELIKGSSISWAKAFTKIGRSKVAHLKKGGSIYVHQAFSRADGGMSIVGEYFGQEVSALGVANALMGGGGAAMKKMVLQDMIALDLSSELELTNAQLFSKPKSDVLLPAGSSMLGPGVIAMMMKFQGSFDYQYSQDLSNGQGSITAYESWEKKEKGIGKETKLNFLSYYTDSGEYESSVFALKSDANSIDYFPAKPGYIMIQEYFRKDKRIELRLEPVQ